MDALDEDRFCQCCRLLLEKSEALRDSWSWEKVQGSQEGYLRKTLLRSIVTKSNSPEVELQDQQSSEAVPEHDEESAEGDEDAGEHEEGAEGDEEDAEEDGAVVLTCAPAEEHRWFQFEFHVVFSSSFMTPVLYFRAFTLEGKSLSLEEVWSFIRPKLRLSSQDALLHTITQQEHPLLGQPFFMLHPCKTQDFMKPLLQMAERENRALNFVLTWLSVVGPLVGLEVPLEYSLDSKPDYTFTL